MLELWRKNIKVCSLITIFLVMVYVSQGNAATNSINTTINVTAGNTFSAGFYTDENVIYSTTVPFSDVDPTKSMVYPNGRAADDGKSDTSITCLLNEGVPWYLKIQGTYSEGLPEDSVKYYFSQPWNRNTDERTGGELTYGERWLPIPTEPTTIYTSGYDDTINTPFGTLASFSFAVDPRGLQAGETYTVTVTYTITTAP